MKSIHFAASVVVIFCLSVSGGAEEQPFAYEICLSENRIELGTHAALSLVITNTSPEEIVVMSSGAVFKLPERYESIEPKARTNPNTPHAWDVAPGETLFLVDSVPRDVAFTPLLLGRHTGTAAFEVRWGRGRSELVGLFPMFDDPRPASAQSGRAVLRIPVSYEIVPPSERWMPLRQKYTREVVVHDLLQGGKEVVAYRLDAAGFAQEVREEADRLWHQEYPDGGKSLPFEQRDGAYARQEAIAFAHPLYRLSQEFVAYVGLNLGLMEHFNRAIPSFRNFLDGRTWDSGSLNRGFAAIDANPVPTVLTHIGRTRLLMVKKGFQEGRSYLRSVDVTNFDCAARALYRDVLALVEAKAQDLERLPPRVLRGVEGEP